MACGVSLSLHNVVMCAMHVHCILTASHDHVLGGCLTYEHADKGLPEVEKVLKNKAEINQGRS